MMIVQGEEVWSLHTVEVHVMFIILLVVEYSEELEHDKSTRVSIFGAL